jgi:hypothetical protein
MFFSVRARLCVLPLAIATALSTAHAVDMQASEPGQGPTADAHAHHQHATQESWTAQPLLNKAPNANRRVKLLRVEGIGASMLTVQAPTEAGEATLAEQILLQDGKAGVRVRGRLQGGWYRVSARSDDGNSRAGTLVYFGNPGPAPRHMLQASLEGLDLSPAILPTEHQNYRAGETWPFLVRMDGEPLAGQTVRLETSAGTARTFVSNGQGLVQVSFPDDFPPPEQREKPQGGHHHRFSQQFVLSTRADSQNGPQHASFNYEYRPGAYDQKNLWLGGGFALLGMLAAAPLVRQRKRQEPAK